MMKLEKLILIITILIGVISSLWFLHETITADIYNASANSSIETSDIMLFVNQNDITVNIRNEGKELFIVFDKELNYLETKKSALGIPVVETIFMSLVIGFNFGSLAFFISCFFAFSWSFVLNIMVAKLREYRKNRIFKNMRKLNI